MKKSFIVVSIFVAICILSVGTVIINNNYKKVSLSHNNIIKETNTEYEYIPIPIEKQAQYKAEIEKYIDVKTPVIKNNIDKSVQNAKNTYLKFINDRNKLNLKEKYLDEIESYRLNVEAEHSGLYIGLFDITSNYVNIKNILPSTGDLVIIDVFFSPYMENNNISNRNKIHELFIYSAQKDKYFLKLKDKISDY